MDNQEQINNQAQIIRHDARGCFVEAKCDCFHLDRLHLQFVTYDKSRPKGQRYTNNIHIYLAIPEFLVLYQEAAIGALHARMQQYKQTGRQDALFESLGGTSAEQLAFYNKSRPDGKSLSRVARLVGGSKSDYLFAADSGPGDQNEQGLIVPRFGKNPEQHVAISFTWRKLNEFLFMCYAHYQAWLAARYAAEWTALQSDRHSGKKNSRQTAARSGAAPGAKQAGASPPPAPSAPPAAPPQQQSLGFGSIYGTGNGRNSADDTRLF